MQEQPLYNYYSLARTIKFSKFPVDVVFFFYLAAMHTVKTVTLSLGFVASLTVVGSVNQREQNKVSTTYFECSHNTSKMVILHSSGVELHYSSWAYLAVEDIE